MKKTFLVLIILLMGIIVFGQDLKEATGSNLGENILSNNKISVDVYLSKEDAFIRQIKNMETNTDFLVGNGGQLWTLEVKKHKDYNGPTINLTPKMAEELFVDKTENKIVAIWKNVKTGFMPSGFDVTCSVEIIGENSYWDASVTPNKEYGIWAFAYPKVCDIDAKNGDELLWPIRGGRIYNEFDNPKGFKLIQPCPLEYSLDIGFFSPGSMQIVSFTKNNSSLYICPEDKDVYVKTTNITQTEPNKVLYIPRAYPNYPAVAGEGFNMPYKFNLAVVNGDWYNVMKKYRKWGISANYGPFANGKLEERKDLPNWYKYNNLWFTYEGWCETACDSLVESQKILDMPAIVHMYHHSQYPFDTHYPNWVPEKEMALRDIPLLQSNNMHVMPYTNAHLVDTNLSDYYKEFGDVLLAKNQSGEPYYEGWATDLGAKNASGCIGGPYYDVYKGELKKLLKATNFDAIYFDQIGGMEFRGCFNEKHNHTVAGHFVAENYRKLVKEAREELSKEKGALVPITTEDCSDNTSFDGWLRINDGDPALMEIPANMFAYSDYVVNFGVYNNSEEMLKNNEVAGMNKAAINLTRGYQIGWSIGSVNELTKAPAYAKYLKNVCKTREAFVKYFNFGEMVRPVKILSDNPKMNLYYFYHNALPTNQGDFDFQAVRTCSFNYKGKTMLCFTNISDDSIKVSWTCKSEDLNLNNKKNHKINILWEKGTKTNKILKNTGKGENISSTFTLNGKDVAILVID